jgi:formamidopyrimidine-DNA glycosylase
MPELPEVQTTVNGLQEHIVGLTIVDVWSDYNSPYFKGSETIKDRVYFEQLKKQLLGQRVVAVTRRAKNILIHVNKVGAADSAEQILLVHMKMTGHLLYGMYHFDDTKKKDPWQPISPESLTDPFNRHVHFMLSFSNKKNLALSDVRKFAKVALVDTATAHDSSHLHGIGPEPLENAFDFEAFAARVNLRPQGKIKQILMDQSIIAGIGNIYADESLWRAGIHPLQKVATIKTAKLKTLFAAIKTTLARGIDFGGDSTSDYRNVLGEKGEFHEKHRAYQRTGEKCSKKGCTGTIRRIVVGGRGTHYCDMHQKVTKN